jgi:hypothetical protein
MRGNATIDARIGGLFDHAESMLYGCCRMAEADVNASYMSHEPG